VKPPDTPLYPLFVAPFRAFLVLSVSAIWDKNAAGLQDTSVCLTELMNMDMLVRVYTIVMWDAPEIGLGQ
jgi:hypothetical protein